LDLEDEMTEPSMEQLLVEMEQVAGKATPGPWAYQEDSDAYTHIVRQGEHPLDSWMDMLGRSE
jgi:hypothetical protein